LCATVLAISLAPAAEITPSQLEAQLALIKKRTEERIASSKSDHDALTPAARLAAPPNIWMVDGVLTEFKECAECPLMVVIPAGEFTMGSPSAEQGAEKEHRVTLAAPFAVSKMEVTFEEWDACVADGGCGGYRPDDQEWGRGKHPVINVSWQNGQAYVDWLRRKTGKPYRLLSEAEWEYAARAGTTTRYAHGETLSPQQANFDATTDGSGPSDENRQRTVPVGSFPANRFGLHDMSGNVSEWVED